MLFWGIVGKIVDLSLLIFHSLLREKKGGERKER